MDNTESISTLKEIVGKFCDARDWGQYHNAKDLSIGISSEAGELLQIFRFKSEEQVKLMFSDNIQRERICNELSDILFFILRFSQMNNIDLSSELRNKLKKITKNIPSQNQKVAIKNTTSYKHKSHECNNTASLQ